MPDVSTLTLRHTIYRGTRGLDVYDWQNYLGIKADGNFGPITDAATKEWQKAHNLLADGIVNASIWAFVEGVDESTMATIINVPGIERLTLSDIRALIAMANRLKSNPDHHAIVQGFESLHTFSPSVRNHDSNAVGVIQFLPSTAARLLGYPDTKEGHTQAADRMGAMTYQEQLKWVEKYFLPYVGRLDTLENVYLAVFYPKEINKSPTDVIGTAGDGTKVYEQNSGFDQDHKGYITRADVTRTIVGQLTRALSNPRIVLPMGTAAAMTLGIMGFGMYKALTLRHTT